jgi:TRAP-type mannitol/chloroaromatic compound transport system permease small subunit
MVDALNLRVGKIVSWLILISVLVSAGNAVVRYSLDTSSNAWLELQWYLYSAVFLLCAGYTQALNEHIRIDIIFNRLPPRVRAMIDIFGGLFFLLPMALIILWLSIPMVEDSIVRHEVSADAGGLLRWPVKILIPIAFALLSLQGVSEIIKRVAFLMGLIPDPAQKHGAHGSAAEILSEMT